MCLSQILYYYRAKIVDKSYIFSVLSASELIIIRVDTIKKLEEKMHVHVRHLSEGCKNCLLYCT